MTTHLFIRICFLSVMIIGSIQLIFYITAAIKVYKAVFKKGKGNKAFNPNLLPKSLKLLAFFGGVNDRDSNFDSYKPKEPSIESSKTESIPQAENATQTTPKRPRKKSTPKKNKVKLEEKKPVIQIYTDADFSELIKKRNKKIG